MIDRPARDRLVAVLTAHLRGEASADNSVVDDAFVDYAGEDRSIDRIGRELWFTYDDIKRHPISVSRKGWQLYKRCIAFLLTDSELPPRHQDTGDPSVWPFQSRQSLIRARPDLRSFGLPRYDVTVRAVPIRAWDVTLRLRMLPVAIVAGWLAYLFWKFWC